MPVDRPPAFVESSREASGPYGFTGLNEARTKGRANRQWVAHDRQMNVPAGASSTFNAADGDGYEQLMGRWSRRLAVPFLDFAGLREASRCSTSAAAPAA